MHEPNQDAVVLTIEAIDWQDYQSRSIRKAAFVIQGRRILGRVKVAALPRALEIPATTSHPFPSSLSPGRGKRGRGVGVRGYFQGFWDSSDDRDTPRQFDATSASCPFRVNFQGNKGILGSPCGFTLLRTDVPSFFILG